MPAENAYEKIHFYFDTAEYANLENATELAAATASVKTDYATALGVAQRRGRSAEGNENVYITVQFVSDYNVYIPNIDDMFYGTSASAPLVAACAALYYEYHYENVSSAAVPAVLVRAVLTASANKTNDYNSVSVYHLADAEVGAGIVDLGKMLSTDVSFSVFTVQGASASEFKSISIALTAGTEVCVALNWNVSTIPIMYESALSGSIDAPDIDMLLYNPNGTVVARSIYSGNSSAEYIRYTVTTTGTYRVVLGNCENYTVTQQYGFAYSEAGG